MVRPRSTEEARGKVAEFTAARVTAIHLAAGTPADAAEAVLEAGRTAGTPVFAHASTAAEVSRLVDAGASVFIGMIRDTEGLDPEFLSRLRTLRIVFAPALGGAGGSVDVAKRNTLRLFQAGVPLALATEGRPIQQELELLAGAGIPPIDIIVAASRNGAMALRTTDRGTVEAGRRADLLLLSANPAEDVANYRRVVLRMSGGAWVK
jgi:imidazolonepropionase-like amidohydrolase